MNAPLNMRALERASAIQYFVEVIASEDQVEVTRIRDELGHGTSTQDAREPDRVAGSFDHAIMSWHFLAFVTDGVGGADSVAGLLEQARMVVVGAYDGESVLLWRRG